MFFKIYNSEREAKLLHNMPNFYLYSFQIRPRAQTVDVSIATSQEAFVLERGQQNL